VVTPHGVLFRGGAECEIRRGIVEYGRLETVIGIGANVFHGTAIPACILMLRGTNGSLAERRGEVLFINAEREVVTGRTQNRLAPAHVEKILSAFRDWSEIPGFSRVVSLGEIAENDFNLNIRRYVDTSPPAEPPLDVRAALFGGVPRRGVEAEAQGFGSSASTPRTYS
jgi:type I restriction enzyme M protein